MLKTALIFSSFLFSSGIATQEIPQELYDLGMKECTTSCTPAFGKAVCFQLCQCSMNEFKKRLQLKEYLSLKAATLQGNISVDQRKVMDSIAKTCDAKLTLKVPKPKIKKPVPKPGELKKQEKK
ncbi:hypothetical protein QGN29_09795 [Temperatibacter marinus]|uniref:Uncharacterized protein n=1 Tax=Temperatibacter marinus TaxID=1456591 RepID=A0AA52EG04_9PROT|nr:hypothetical protein [Temperatibacter marinus]WND01842.1 hypothetical protein QGN29_09795 [Temperatibacter marinus]